MWKEFCIIRELLQLFIFTASVPFCMPLVLHFVFDSVILSSLFAVYVCILGTLRHAWEDGIKRKVSFGAKSLKSMYSFFFQNRHFPLTLICIHGFHIFFCNKIDLSFNYIFSTSIWSILANEEKICTWIKLYNFFLKFIS